MINWNKKIEHSWLRLQNIVNLKESVSLFNKNTLITMINWNKNIEHFLLRLQNIVNLKERVSLMSIERSGKSTD